MPIVVIVAAIAASLVVIIVVIQRQSSTGGPGQAEDLEHALHISSEVAYYLARGDRLNAVKVYRNETGLGLKEATVQIDVMLKQAKHGN